MNRLTATARGVAAALVAATLAPPAAGLASDGATGANSGGGTSYHETSAAGERISLRVARGAWLGRATRVRGRSAELAGRTVAVERRRSRRRGWVTVGAARVGGDGGFALRWRPRSAGRHELRAVSATASSAGTARARAASAVARVTVYRRVTATWYGPGFYGNRTACGRRLTPRTAGVAHRTLPCGARVAIRAGGRSAVVPVIDRGPYARGVAYDLTSATARRLGVAHTARIGAAILSR
jgi:rare lipoprotein A